MSNFNLPGKYFYISLFLFFIASSLKLVYVDGNPDGFLTDEAVNVCRLLAITPEDIVLREIGQFKKPGFTE